MIVVGTGLAGASAASTLAGMGYQVECFCYQDSARRAHSIAAQGGINATKDYANEGDSIHRLFVDTIKGGDFRAREANVWRLAELSTGIIDQAVAQGVPFNREYGGMLATRSFGGVLVERTFYCRGQTGQQLLLGAYQALQKQVADGQAKVHTRHEMLDLVLVDGRGARDRRPRPRHRRDRGPPADAVVLATGGYCNVYYLSTNAKNCNVTAIWRAHKRGAGFANPCFTQIHPTCIPQSRRLPVEAHPDERVAAQRRPDLGPAGPRRGARRRRTSPRRTASTTSRSATRATATSFPATSPRGRRRSSATRASGSARTGRGVYLDFRDAIEEKGAETIAGRYGNLFSMYERITGDSPWETPMKIYPAPHYSMGGLWVDYTLQTTIPGLFAIGEANFSDHGANRLGASAMMQCLADGYFILPHTVTDYLARPGRAPRPRPRRPSRRRPSAGRASASTAARRSAAATPARVFHRRLGHVMLDRCGITRDEEGLRDGDRGDRARSATSSGATCGSTAPARSSTRASSTPAGSPTSSSSPS